MADVKKCDVCGAIYPKFHETWSSEFHESKRLKNPVNINLRWEFKDTDCCPSCTEKIKAFVDILKDNGDNFVITTYQDSGDKDDVEAYHCGDKRINDALDIAYRYGQSDGAHHKAWVIDQMVQALLRDDYDAWVEKYKHNEEDGVDDYYEWDVGIAP